MKNWNDIGVTFTACMNVTEIFFWWLHGTDQLFFLAKLRVGPDLLVLHSFITGTANCSTANFAIFIQGKLHHLKKSPDIHGIFWVSLLWTFISVTTLAQHSHSQRIVPEYLLYNLLPQLLSFYINWEGRHARAIDQSLSRIPLSCPHPRALGPCGPRKRARGCQGCPMLRQMWNESNHPEFSCSQKCVIFFFVFSTPFQPHDIFVWLLKSRRIPATGWAPPWSKWDQRGVGSQCTRYKQQ